MSSTRTIWSFIDEVLAERAAWRFYAVHIGRKLVLTFGIELEATIFLCDVGTGRRISVSLRGEDPPTLRDLSRAGYAIDRIGRYTFAIRPFATDRELVAEVRRWEAIARDGSLHHLPTRRKRRLLKRSTTFPTSAIAMVRGLDEWRTAFAGVAIRSPATVLRAPSLALLTFATVSVIPSQPTHFDAGANVYAPRENAASRAELKTIERRMRALLADRKYRRLGGNNPDMYFFEKKLRSLAELRRERKRLAVLVAPHANVN